MTVWSADWLFSCCVMILKILETLAVFLNALGLFSGSINHIVFSVIDTAYLHKGNKMYTKTISRHKQLKHVACAALRWWEVNVHHFCGCIAFHVPKCCSAQWKCCHLVGENYPTPLDGKQKCSIFINPYSTDCTRNALLYGWNMQTLLSYTGFWLTIYIYF